MVVQYLALACPQLRWWQILSGPDGNISVNFPASWSDFLGVMRCCAHIDELPLRVQSVREMANDSSCEELVHTGYGPKLYMDGEGEAEEIAKLLIQVLPGVHKCRSRFEASEALAQDVTRLLDIARTANP
jgi:hypothetical protein